MSWIIVSFEGFRIINQIEETRKAKFASESLNFVKTILKIDINSRQAIAGITNIILQ